MIVDKEMKIIKLSVIVLCFSFVFVYVVWFYVQGDKIKSIENHVSSVSKSSSTTVSATKNNTLISSHNTVSHINNHIDNNINSDMRKNKDMNEKIDTETKDIESYTEYGEYEKQKNTQVPTISVQNKQEFFPPQVSEKKILLGTKIIDSTVSFAESLGISYQYALKDDNGIVFLFLGEGLNNDFAEIADQHDGTLYAINTEFDIKKHELFGDRMLFLNIPGYEKKFVLMIVKHNNSYWMIGIDYAKYHKSKSYLKSLFID